MEKQHIIRFFTARKRGRYSLLVKFYADIIASMPVTMAMELIKEDLEKESDTKVNLNYYSLAKAISRFKCKTGTRPTAETSQKRVFKDQHEIKNVQKRGGYFNAGGDKVKDVQGSSIDVQ